MSEVVVSVVAEASSSCTGSVDLLRTLDRCTKCGLCQAYCPVAAVTPAFPGPKYTGPQAERFRVIESVMESAPDLCSGCGICSSVCPNDVAVSDIIALAKQERVARGQRLTLAQRLLNRPDLLGSVAGRAPRLANAVLRSRTLRWVAERVLGIDRRAPLPPVAGPAFRRWFARQRQPAGAEVRYFTGCAVENFDAGVGIALVRVLNALGLRVSLPSRRCCALPMLSSGEREPAARRAEALLSDLAAGQEGPIVSTSTSCSLTLRRKYAAYLDLNDARAGQIAADVVDACEYLVGEHGEALGRMLGPMPRRVLYHGPCQLRGHGMGQPAVELLRLVPGLDVVVSRAECCGVGGTYGYTTGKAEIARAIGVTLLQQVEEIRPDLIVCDSETCRWNIQQASGLRTVHPLELLAEALAVS